MQEEQILKSVHDRVELQIFCLGKFRVLRNNKHDVVGVNSKHKQWSLFKYLVMQRGSSIPTEIIIEALWPEQEDHSDTAALRTTFSRLKSSLEPQKRQNNSGYISYSKDSCSFNPTAPYWLDIEEFEKLYQLAQQQAIEKPEKAVINYLRAIEIYHGELFADDSFSWVNTPRELYRRMFIVSVRKVVMWFIDRAECQEAQILLEKALEIDPYIEDFQLMLIKTYLTTKEFGNARKNYNHYTALMYRDLGVRPSTEMKELYRELKEGEQSLNKYFRKQDDSPGAVICNSSQFWNLLLLERRRVEREAVQTCFLLFEFNKEFLKEYEVGLKRIEPVICNCLRKTDVVCRIDQYHLAILLPETVISGAEIVCSHLEELFETIKQSRNITLKLKLQWHQLLEWQGVG